MSEQAKPIDDGGSAFPTQIVIRTVNNTGDLVDSTTYGVDGMSLRDWFAGQAMAALMTTAGALHDGFKTVYREQPEYMTQVAVGAYRFADAMLAARKSEGGAK